MSKVGKTKVQINFTEPQPKAAPAPLDKSQPLREQIIQAIQQVADPEMSINVYDLGLIYEINIDEAKQHANIVMTLTTAWCPVADQIVADVKAAAERPDGIKTADVKVTFDPPWTRAMMTEAGKLESGLL